MTTYAWHMGPAVTSLYHELLWLIVYRDVHEIANDYIHLPQ